MDGIIITAATAILFQEAFDKEPIKKNVILGNFCSGSEIVLTKLIKEENILDTIIPANTKDRFFMFLILEDISITINIAKRPKVKLTKVTIKVLKPSNIDRAAPKAAADEVPKISGDTIGF